MKKLHFNYIVRPPEGNMKDLHNIKISENGQVT